MSLDVRTKGVEMLRCWLEVENARPEQIGEIVVSDLPKCPHCGRQMTLKHSRRTATWAVKHELFNHCPEALAPGIWRKNEKDAVAEWLSGAGRRSTGGNPEAAGLLITRKLHILEEQKRKESRKSSLLYPQ